jgi:nitroreductase
MNNGANHELLPMIADRYSPRAFSSAPVSAEDISLIFDAARRAPSSSNEQPWRFLAGPMETPELHDRMVDVLSEGNRVWAKNAPLLVLAIARRDFRQFDAANRHAWYDTGFAVANLTYQALSLGIYAHPMGGFDAEAARQIFGVPEGYDPVVMIALGYPGDPDILPEPLRGRELQRTPRLPLGEILRFAPWSGSIKEKGGMA